MSIDDTFTPHLCDEDFLSFANIGKQDTPLQPPFGLFLFLVLSFFVIFVIFVIFAIDTDIIRVLHTKSVSKLEQNDAVLRFDPLNKA